MEKRKTLNRYLPVACQGIENAQQGAMRAPAVRMVLKYQGSYVGAHDIMLLSLPKLREDQPAHRPFVAAHAKPWLGKIVVYRGAAADGFALLTSFDTRARVGALAADFYVGPVSRFDLGNALVIVLYSGTPETVADINSKIMQTARFYFCEGAALMALAAVILGETSLFGGGGIIFAGSLLIGTINNGRIIIGLDISEEDGCWRHHYSGLSVWKDAHGLARSI